MQGQREQARLLDHAGQGVAARGQDGRGRARADHAGERLGGVEGLQRLDGRVGRPYQRQPRARGRRTAATTASAASASGTNGRAPWTRPSRSSSAGAVQVPSSASSPYVTRPPTSPPAAPTRAPATDALRNGSGAAARPRASATRHAVTTSPASAGSRSPVATSSDHRPASNGRGPGARRSGSSGSRLRSRAPMLAAKSVCSVDVGLMCSPPGSR
ncbi:hypothetical protein BJF79_24860 [Actinomadura sp. CNU-125]|nr:hypothetical protein BJF79_24860 [Actinomadura sp. CNU-125]